MINIVFEDNHLLVVEKPINMPSQKDDSNDLDLLTYLKKYIKDKYNKPGNVYLALLHRLDRPVGGLMVFAKTSKAAQRMNEQIKNKKMYKQYIAVVEGVPGNGIFNNKLIIKNKNVVVSSIGKDAQLKYKTLQTVNNLSLVAIELITGRKHQIRVQFSHNHYPIYGDQRYNKNAVKNQQIALFAKKIEFVHPVTKKIMTFELPLPKKNPFSLFMEV